MSAADSRLLRFDDLALEFPGGDGPGRDGAPAAKVLNGVDLSLERGEILGLVGESGSGKTVAGLATLGLLDRRARFTRGRLEFRGENIIGQSPAQHRRRRGLDIAMVFQDPMTSLNPFLRIGTQIIEVLRRRGMSRPDAKLAGAQWLGKMGLPKPEAQMKSYPHEMSGGMRQRVLIAIALALEPELLIADEPTTALDVTTQAEILALFLRLRETMGTAIIFITHDLGAVAGLADRMAVMYGGRIVEEAPVETFFAAPAHPYSQGLMASRPPLEGPRPHRLKLVGGTPPDPRHLPAGCAFAARCIQATSDLSCEELVPPDRQFGAQHRVACFWEGPR
ncbi:MAG: ABC transporter ATP-binding protein [Planctomycetota bacterium]